MKLTAVSPFVLGKSSGPSVGARTYHLEVSPMRIPDQAATQKLLQVIPLRSPFGARDRAMIILALHTGLRVSELTGLDVGHVWFQGQPRLWLDLPGAICKYNRSRQLPLNLDAQAAITELIRFLVQRGFSIEPHSPLLTDRRHRRLPVREVQRCVQNYREKAGLDLQVTPHSFRHAFASSLALMGATPYQIKELLGHLDIATSNIYVENQPGELEAVVNRLLERFALSSGQRGG